MNAKTYMKDIRNRKIMILKKADIIRQLPADDTDCEQLRVELQEDIKAYNEKYSKVRKCIEELPVAQYNLVFRVYVLGQTLREVANHADRSYSWATLTHSQAFKALQKMFDEMGM